MSETDLKLLCRICLCQNRLCSNIYVGQSTDKTPVYEVINYVYDLEISIDDGLPEYVCQECLGIVNEFGNYKRNAQRAKKELLLLRQKRNVFIKVEEEEYLDSADGEVTEDGQIHEPQIEIHERVKNPLKEEDQETKNNFNSNDIPVIQKSEMNLCDQATSLQTSSWLNDANCGSINYVEYHNSEKICNDEPDMKVEPGEVENWAGRENNCSFNGSSGLINSRRDEILKGRRKRKIGAEEEGMEVEEFPKVVIKTESVEEGVNEEECFSCHHCGVKRKSKSELKEHINHIHSTIFPAKGREDNNESKKNGNWCTFCQKTFNSKSSLVRHIKNHSGEKPFQCHICDYKTSNSSNLKTHILMHTGEKPFKCYICEYTTSYSSALKTHILIHTGEKPFKCNICEYSTAVRSNLKAHMFTHTDEKQFKCNMCNYSVTKSSSFRKHMLKHK